jgi:hypothetical protein
MMGDTLRRRLIVHFRLARHASASSVSAAE